MEQYLEHLRYILRTGNRRSDRTGTGTLSVFGYQNRYDLSQGLPVVTTKKVFLKGVIHELLWMLAGDTNITYLRDHGVHIWDEWADESGSLGPVYGKQWRSWPVGGGQTVDQIKSVIESLRESPHSRRHVVSAWNVADLPEMRLAPCHCLFQFYVSNGRLSCQLYQRSADMFLGVPFNIASYAILTCMIAHVCGYEPGEFVHSFGDSHIYLNHIEQVRTQLSRSPRPLPKLRLSSRISFLNDFTYDDIEVLDYHPHPAIKAEVAV